MTGTYATGLAAFAAVFVIGMIVLLELGARWSERWSPAACRQAGVYSHRVAWRRWSAGERAA
jgi:hypothetical protein